MYSDGLPDWLSVTMQFGPACVPATARAAGVIVAHTASRIRAKNVAVGRETITST